MTAVHHPSGSSWGQNVLCTFFLSNPFGSGIGCPHFYFRISSLAIERSVNPCLEVPQRSYIVLIHTTSHRSGPFVYWCTKCSSRTACKFLSANTFCGRNGQIFEYVLASYVLQYDKVLSSLFSFEKLSLVMMCITYDTVFWYCLYIPIQHERLLSRYMYGDPLADNEIDIAPTTTTATVSLLLYEGKR